MILSFIYIIQRLFSNNGYNMTRSEFVSCSKKWVQKLEPHSCMIKFRCPTGGLNLNHDHIDDVTKRNRTSYVYGEESLFRKRRVRQQEQ